MADTRFTWGQFTEIVRTLLTTDKDRLGLQDTTNGDGKAVPGYISRLINQAVLDLQEYIVPFRRGHENTYLAVELEVEGQASRGVLPPSNDLVSEAFLISPVQGGGDPVLCPLTGYPWEERQDLIDGEPDVTISRISINPDGSSFLVYPALKENQTVRLVWDGKKSDFADEDLVPFPEDAALAVAEYVKGFIAREVDNDLARFATYFHATEGSYIKLRKQLYLAARKLLRTDV